MANLSLPYPDFVAGTSIVSQQADDNNAAIVNYINARNSGSTAWDKVSSAGVISTSTSGTSAANAISINGANNGFYLGSSPLGAIVVSVNGVDACYFTKTSSPQLQASGGSASAPTYSFGSGTNYGMYLGGSQNQTILVANGTSGAVLDLLSNGDILTSQIAPLATGATAGFFFLPTMAGTPTGTPSTYTGQAAILIDTSGSKIWTRIGASWKSVAVA
jgi:hypothetical protein